MPHDHRPLRLVLVALCSVVPGGVLVGCSGESSEVGEVQEVQSAWIDGVASDLRVPDGIVRFRVTSLLDQPVQGAEGTGPFIGVAWDTRPASPTTPLNEVGGAFEVVAVIDGEKHDLGAQSGENTYGQDYRSEKAVVLGVPDGYDLADLRLEISIDGVVQTLDPWTGEVEAGDAAVLYEDVVTTWQTPGCGKLGASNAVSSHRSGSEILCTLSPVTTRAWTADLGWAEPGTLWWTFSLSTQLVNDNFGPEAEQAVWATAGIELSEVTFGGRAPEFLAPIFEGSADQFASSNPDLSGASYTFSGPATLPGSPDAETVQLTQRYALEATADLPAPEEGLVIDQVIPIGPVAEIPAPVSEEAR